MIINQLCSKSVSSLSLFLFTAISFSLSANNDVFSHDRLILPSTNEQAVIMESLQSIGGLSESREVDFSIKPFENTGFYFLDGVEKNKKLFVDSTGKYLFRGDVFEIRDGAVLPYKDPRLISETLLSLLTEQDGIVYGDGKNIVYVFVDITCSFCKKFHKETVLPNLDKNIKFVYFPFLRNPLDSKTKSRMLDLFCVQGNDQRKSFYDGYVRGNRNVQVPECENNRLGRMLFELIELENFIGTPTMVFPDGKVLSGHLSYDDLQKRVK
jgi:thiol:disulfide interchange protein DsbC